MVDEQFDQEIQITFKDYLHKLYRGRWIIIFSLITVLAATAYYTFTADPVYEASTKVIIKEHGNVGESLFEFGSLIKKETMLNNQVEILKSRTLAETVVRKLQKSATAARLGIFQQNEDPQKPKSSMLGRVRKALMSLFGNPEKSRPEKQNDVFDQMAESLRKSISVSPITNTDMIEIKVSANDPEQAAFLANTLTESYAEMNRRMSQEEVRQVKNFLDEQLKIVQQQLAESENALRKFQEQEKVVALPHETKELIENIAEFEGLYNSALTELNSNRERLAYINEQLGRSKESFDIESISPTPYLEQLRRQLAELESQKASYLANLIFEGVDFRNHPKLQKLEDQIDILRKRFKEHIQLLAQREIIDPVAMSEQLWSRKLEVEAEIEALKPKVNSLKKIIDKYAQQLTRLPEKSLKLAQLERAAKVDEKIFIMMKEKYQESRITEVGQLGDVRIIDPARPPAYPVKPRKKLNLILGVMLGLGLGIGFSFLIDAIDNSVRVMEDLSRIGMPVLGAIPEIKSQDALKRLKVLTHVNGTANGNGMLEEARQMAARLITHFAPKSPISEAYRSFRTNLQYSRIDKPLRTILITSPGPGEGKSTTVANLAITIAQMGSRVLLVDADLRRPVLHSVFRLDRRVGLTNVLVGRVTLEEAVKESEIENLSILPSGTLPPNPSELLGSSAMRKLVDEMKRQYDVILFDSPPVIAVTDAAVLCKSLDGVVLVVKSGQTDRSAAAYANTLLGNLHTNLLGGLLNGVNVENMYGSYYYYYHYYYYYYGKDDYQKGKNRRKWLKA